MGIPTRCLHSDPSHTKAILFVGEAPAFNEDKVGQCWVGISGQVLQKFITTTGLELDADIFLGNACRCCLPQHKEPSAGQINKCRVWLQQDLDILAAANYEEIYLFCQGRFGFQAVTHLCSLEGQAFKSQGRDLSTFTKGLQVPGGYTGPIRVFSTYHPAALLPGSNQHDKSARTPSRVIAVQDHFALLARVVRGEVDLAHPNPEGLITHVNEPMPPMDTLPGQFIVDIETYGILANKPEQTEFQPVRSACIDNVPTGKQIVSVTFLYRDELGLFQAYYYPFPGSYTRLLPWFKAAAQEGVVLVGQNIKFDISYLRAHHPLYRYWLDPRRVVLDDTLLWSFLAYEHRPERSLKTLSYLFGIYDYSHDKVVGGHGKASSSRDPDLIKYNVIDCRNTYELLGYYQTEIRKMYGKETAKFSDLCRQMRNWILWDVILLEEAGIGLDTKYLTKLQTRCTHRCDVLSQFCGDRGLKLAGGGSEKSKRKLLWDIFEAADMLSSRAVLYTDRTKELSVGIENVNLAMLNVKRGSREGQLLRAWTAYTSRAKLLSSYVTPLLSKPAKGILYPSQAVPGVGVVHPYWFPMPSEFAKSDGSGAVGGQKQGRFSAQKPGEPTFPKEIKRAVASRFPGGTIQRWDMSQIELRVAAFLSGDRVMLQEYREGIDRHLNMAKVIWPGMDHTDPAFRKTYRPAGKMANFLIIYKGGAQKLVDTIMADLGLEVNVIEMQAAIDRIDARYHEFRKWQDDMIESVRQKGYWELPTGWSRYWGSGDCINGKVSEIADFPCQTIAAQLLQSSLFAIHCDLLQTRCRSYIFDNIYDSLGVDTCPGEEKIVDAIVEKHLTNSPLYAKLLEVIGQDRRIPLLFEKEK